MVKIIIADDHALVRKGLGLFIGYEDNMNVVAEATDGEELLEIVEEYKADVLLLDIEMPKINGITAIRKIKEIAPKLKIIVLTMHPEDIYGKTAKQLGANGYFLKDREPKKLIQTINKVYKGKTAFTEKAKKSQKREKPVKLSKREIEVLRLLSDGKSNKDISVELGISDKTVSTYKLRLLNKVGGKTVVDLIHFASNYPDIMGAGD